MNDTLSRLKTAVRAIQYLGNTDMLSWKEKGVAIMKMLLKFASGRPGETGISFGRKTLVLDAFHVFDWRVYRDVFVRKEYATGYENSVVVDIGAHRGIYAAYAIQKDCAALLAYEPEPVNFAFLKRNAECFSSLSQKVHTHQQAVGAKAGNVSLFEYEQSWSHSLFERAGRTPVSKLEVRQEAFDEVLSKAAAIGKGKRIIVKIDAEGAEYDILQNASREKLALIDELFVETHDYAAGDPSELIRHLSENGMVRLRGDTSSGKRRLHHLVRDRESSATSNQETSDARKRHA